MLSSTQQKIEEAGKQEFLSKGFAAASLRSIASEAGVTTGAIYGYYPDKGALFKALVEPAATEFRNLFLSAQSAFEALPEAEQKETVRSFSNASLTQLLGYIYDHFDAFRLIVCCSAGTEYEAYIESLVDIETRATLQFAAVMQKTEPQLPLLSDNLVHILCNACFSAVFETVAHNMPKAEAYDYVNHICAFFQAGWSTLLGYG